MSRMLNFRADDDLVDAIDEARGKVSRSTWLREVAAKAAGMGKDSSPHPERALALQPKAQNQDGTPNGECQHPKPGLKKMPYGTWCGVCGVRVR